MANQRVKEFCPEAKQWYQIFSGSQNQQQLYCDELIWCSVGASDGMLCHTPSHGGEPITWSVFPEFHQKVMCDSCSAWFSFILSQSKELLQAYCLILPLMCSPMNLFHLSLSVLLKTNTADIWATSLNIINSLPSEW